MRDSPAEVPAVQQAVEQLHHCQATFRELVSVVERFEGKTVWEGDVHVFDLNGHPTASICYAWASKVEGSEKQKFYAVLHVPPVTSALEAVRASIVSDFKSK